MTFPQRTALEPRQPADPGQLARNAAFVMRDLDKLSGGALAGIADLARILATAVRFERARRSAALRAADVDQ